ncbi:MAG TPA: hypothetical protein VL326_21455 [Kofleriaceae bacterium]|nr:hypothetical protein [Kofleriaceae bacterium]
MYGALIFMLAMRAAAADEPAPPRCDAAALEQAGNDAWSQGLQTQALEHYEKALRCEPSEARVLKAGFAVCELYQHGRSETYVTKAKHYYELLKRDDNKQKLAQFCVPRCRLEF